MNKREQTARYEIGKVKALIEDGIINCTTAVLMYIEIKLAAGWTRKFTAKEIYQELGISKSSFHRAISKLRASNWINWTAPDETEFEVSRGPKSVADYTRFNSGTALQSWNDQTQGWDDPRFNSGTALQSCAHMTQGWNHMTQGWDSQTQGCNGQAPKPAHSKASTDPSTSSHLYTTYIHREEDGLNANNHETDLDIDNIGSRDPMDLRDPGLDEADPIEDPDPTRDPGSNPMMDPDPIGDPRTKFTQPAPSHLHKETMGGLGSNSMNGNSLSSRLDVKQILEETKRKLMEQVEWQRSQRMQRWATNVLPVGTQGSSLTPGSSDRAMTTTSTFRSSVKPVMRHLG